MITPIGSLCSGANRSTSKFVTLNPGRSVAAGRVLVAWCAGDSIFNVGIPSDGHNYYKLSDSVGNVWHCIGAITDPSGFFRAGALGVLAVCQVKHALATTDTITFVADAVEPGVAYSLAMSIEEFDFHGERWCVQEYGSSFNSLGVDPGNIGKAMAGATREILFLHLLAAEAPSTDSYTWDGSWTQIASAGTNTGTPTDDITVLGGYKLSTAMTEAIDVDSNTADRRYGQVVNAIFPVKPGGAFPTTPLLDNFNRADEDPIDNGTWDTTRFAFGGANLAVVSNQAKKAGGSWWLAMMERCGEAYVEIPVFGRGAHIHFYGQGDSGHGDNDMEGTGAAWADEAFGTVDGSVLRFGLSGQLGRVGGQVAIGYVKGMDGYKIGLKRLLPSGIGGVRVDHLYVDIGSGWEETAAWHLVSGGTVLVGQMALACETGSPTAQLDNFGGGETACGRRFRPDYYRRRS